MRILVVRGGALGDFLLTLPAVAGLREKWPEAEIEMVVARRFGELVLGPNAVNAIRPIDEPGLASFYAAGGSLDRRWADYFTEFDLTISYFFDPDGVFAANWQRAGGTGQYISHDPRNPAEAAWRHLSKPLAECGCAPGDARRLYGTSLVSAERKKERGEELRLVIHPGSGGKKKCWPLQDWVRELEDFTFPLPWGVTWLAGEAEGDLLQEIPEKWRTGAHGLKQSRPLPEVFQVLQSADLYLGHDSGISHLAAWSGVKCGLLFGPTLPAIWAPAGSQVQTWSRGGEWPKEGEWREWFRGILVGEGGRG
jgi:heptosyltransferase-2